MLTQVEHRVDLCDGHVFRASGDLHDLVACFHLAFLQHSQVKARFLVCDQQRSHLWFVHPDTNTVTSDARLCHLKESATDAVLVADAYLFIGQTLNGEIFPELPEDEVMATELMLPIMIG